MKKIYFTLFLWIPFLAFGQQWAQIGEDIDGNGDTNHYFGIQVSLSDDGQVVAGYSSAPSRGISVYHNTGDSWEPLGERIEIGEAFSGSSPSVSRFISLSADGNTIVTGPGLFNYDELDEMVKVYRYNGTEWEQLGQDILGNADGDYFGHSVSISDDGNIIAIGAPGTYPYPPGYVKVYQYNGVSWELLGGQINADGSSGAGYSVSLNADGTKVAFSSSTGGQFYIFSYEDGNWTGGAITGPYTGAIEFSSDGSTVAVGGYSTVAGGYAATVYEYIEDSWVQKGQNILSASPFAAIGDHISINSDGSTFAVGTPSSFLGDSGFVTVYKYTDGEWIAQGDVISAEGASDNFLGSPVSLSADGTVVAYGGPNNTSDTGNVRIFQYVVNVESIEVINIDGTGTEFCADVENVQLEAVVTPGNATETGVIWSIASGEEYASVDENGLVTVLGAGTVTIRATSIENPDIYGEITFTINPLPVLEVENTDVQVCSGNDAFLYAFSEGNVIFWYANEDDTEYVYHGNNFIIEGLTESTSYWVEAYNLATGCRSERVEVTVTVNPVPEAPIAVEVQQVEEGWTLADLEVEAEGELTWYADQALTMVLPETTPVEDDTTYWVTQTVNGCESAATGIFVEQLRTSDINNTEFAYWPNPVKDKLNFDGKEMVQSVQVFDMSGRLLMNQQSATGITQLDVTVLSKGTYIVKAQTDKEVRMFKIVKN